jgi:hypothetical protein
VDVQIIYRSKWGGDKVWEIDAQTQSPC